MEQQPAISIIFPYGSSKKGHLLGVNHLFFASENLYTCGRDGYIKKWQDSQVVQEAFSHRDWITDALFSSNLLFSCSYDHTVNLYSPSDLSILASQVCHSDYIKCMTALSSKKIATGSFDESVAFVKVTDSSIGVFDRVSLPSSVYSIANVKETVYVGLLDHKIVEIDPVIARPVGVYRGHKGVVKCLSSVPGDENLLISGGCDSVLSLWDRRMRKTTERFTFHDDSVWCVKVVDGKVFSGGKDGKIFCVDLENKKYSKIVERKDPVVCIDVNKSDVWVGSEKSSVQMFKIAEDIEEKEVVHTPVYYSPRKSNVDFDQIVLEQKKKDEKAATPDAVLPGQSGICDFVVLNNKRQILAVDSEKRVTLWDLSQGRQIEDFGVEANLEEIVKDLEEVIAVPKWFTVQTKLGMLEVRINEDTAFSIALYPYEAGFSDVTDTFKLVLAEMLLRTVFKEWFSKKRLHVVQKIEKRKLKYFEFALRRAQRMKKNLRMELNSLIETFKQSEELFGEKTKKKYHGVLEECEGRLEDFNKSLKGVVESFKELVDLKKGKIQFLEKVQPQDLEVIHDRIRAEDGLFEEEKKTLEKPLEQFSEIVNKEKELEQPTLKSESGLVNTEKYLRMDLNDVNRQLSKDVFVAKEKLKKKKKKSKSKKHEVKKEVQKSAKKGEKEEKAGEKEKEEDEEEDEGEDEEEDEGEESSDEEEILTTRFIRTTEESLLNNGLKIESRYIIEWEYPPDVQVAIHDRFFPVKKKPSEFTPQDRVPVWVLRPIVKGANPKKIQKISFCLESHDKDALPEVALGKKMSAKANVRVTSILQWVADKLIEKKKFKRVLLENYEEGMKKWAGTKKKKKKAEKKEEKNVEAAKDGKLCEKYSRLKELKTRQVQENKNFVKKNKYVPDTKMFELLSPLGVVLDPMISMGTAFHFFRDKKCNYMTFKYRKRIEL